MTSLVVYNCCFPDADFVSHQDYLYTLSDDISYAEAASKKCILMGGLLTKISNDEIKRRLVSAMKSSYEQSGE